MADNLEKAKVYFQSEPTYWKISQFESEFKEFPTYPLSFKDRLEKNHYANFDEKGLPRFPSKKGNLVYFCTGLCSFGMAHWEMYQITGNKEHAQKLVNVADKLMSMAVEQGKVLMIYDYEDDQGTNPLPCAMNNGEAISVLIRAYAYRGDNSYMEAAIKLGKSFLNNYALNGVSGWIKQEQIWFLEAGKYILNGHIYALFGLMDLAKYNDEEWLKSLVDSGTDSIVSNLDRFDTGNWSYYWVDEPKYIASAMYHNLHICQLEILHKYTANMKFLDFSNRFRKYAKVPSNRLRAGIQLVTGKLKNKFG
tara:strand:+ start:3511 stop:4431 length:921 start_codon:yes stop_codon:yes gene_type:complete